MRIFGLAGGQVLSRGNPDYPLGVKIGYPESLLKPIYNCDEDLVKNEVFFLFYGDFSEAGNVPELILEYL